MVVTKPTGVAFVVERAREEVTDSPLSNGLVVHSHNARHFPDRPVEVVTASSDQYCWRQGNT